MLQVQYHGITDAANLETWRGMSYQTVLTPADEKTGKRYLSLRKGAGISRTAAAPVNAAGAARHLRAFAWRDSRQAAA